MNIFAYVIPLLVALDQSAVVSIDQSQSNDSYALSLLQPLEELWDPRRETVNKLRELSQKDFETRLAVFRNAVNSDREVFDDHELRVLLSAVIGLEDDVRPFADVVVLRMLGEIDTNEFCELAGLLNYLKPVLPESQIHPVIEPLFRRIRTETDPDSLRKLIQATEHVGNVASDREIQDFSKQLTLRIQNHPIQTEQEQNAQGTLTAIFAKLGQHHPEVGAETLTTYLLEKLKQSPSLSWWFQIECMDTAFHSRFFLRGLHVLDDHLTGDSIENHEKVFEILGWAFGSFATRRASQEELRLVSQMMARYCEKQTPLLELARRNLINLSISLPTAEAKQQLRVLMRSLAIDEDSVRFSSSFRALQESGACIESSDIRDLILSRMNRGLYEYESLHDMQFADQINPEHADAIAQRVIELIPQLPNADEPSDLLSLVQESKLSRERLTEILQSIGMILNDTKVSDSLLNTIAHHLISNPASPGHSTTSLCIEMMLKSAESNDEADFFALAMISDQMSDEHFSRYWNWIKKRFGNTEDARELLSYLDNCGHRLSRDDAEFVYDLILKNSERVDASESHAKILTHVVNSLGDDHRRRLAAECIRLSQSKQGSVIKRLSHVLKEIAHESIPDAHDLFLKNLVNRITSGELSDEDPWVMSEIVKGLETIWTECDQDLRHESIIRLAEYIARTDHPSDCTGLAESMSRLCESQSSLCVREVLTHYLSRFVQSYNHDSIDTLVAEFDKLAPRLQLDDAEVLAQRAVSLMNASDDEEVVFILGSRLSQFSSQIHASTARKALWILSHNGGAKYVEPAVRILMGQETLIPDDERRRALVEILKDPAFSDDDFGVFQSFATTLSNSNLFRGMPMQMQVRPREWKQWFVAWAKSPQLGRKYQLNLRNDR